MVDVEGRINGCWIPKVDFYYLRPIIKDFIRKYGDKYPEGFLDDKKLFLKVGSYLAKMEYFQIYHYLDFMDENDDIYYGYYKELKKHFDIDCNILDVASGYIPAFGDIVAKHQIHLPNAKGTIDVCDPVLIFDESKNANMKLIKDKFHPGYDLSSYDLITGIMPCTVTRDIITAACEQDKDFFIGLCTCTPKDYYSIDDKTYMDENIEFARKTCSLFDRELELCDLDAKYNINSPVIYSKKR